MLFSFYLPGNSLAAPTSHHAGGTTMNEEDQQGFLRVPSLLSSGWEEGGALMSSGWPIYAAKSMIF